MDHAEPRWRVWLAVLLLHVALVLGLRTTMWRPSPAAPASPALQWVTLPMLPTRPARPVETRQPSAARLPTAALPRPPVPQVPPADGTLRLVEAPAHAPEPPASAASAPRGSLLDNPASRQALRALGQRPLLSERAAQAMGDDLQRTDGALTQDVQRAAKGDCLHGEFAGAGMGLLSLPALAVAAARGQCAR